MKAIDYDKPVKGRLPYGYYWIVRWNESDNDFDSICGYVYTREPEFIPALNGLDGIDRNKHYPVKTLRTDGWQFYRARKPAPGRARRA